MDSSLHVEFEKWTMMFYPSGTLLSQRSEEILTEIQMSGKIIQPYTPSYRSRILFKSTIDTGQLFHAQIDCIPRLNSQDLPQLSTK